ncbi:glycogen debranching N-terminal domain-containing protein [Amnibacterium sp. CER49]|uniref:glycogen debranching N-terminal domain-containing protein n=1 Tax=Amnibacterium sp. CER49 TaxID=3039161 RepID=UPI00244B86E3|nr:glycogen debranching N-terminal domain-containing protein [Amnibacterium sp. CER49]MDH2444767.1 glycogen debranching N-terminal domain-containing protein [Amnibacterium sp. CER49]
MRQPLLHDAEVSLAAPAQIWCRPDGTLSAPIDGLWISDVRILSRVDIAAAGSPIEHISTARISTARTRFTALLPGLDDPSPDPHVLLHRDRTVTVEGLIETLVASNARDDALELSLTLDLGSDLLEMPAVRRGERGAPLPIEVAGATARWGDASVTAFLTVDDGLEVSPTEQGVALTWRAHVPAHGSATASWTVRVDDAAGVVRAPRRRVPLTAPPTGRSALDAWLRVALDDLEALELALPDAPDDVFLAAGGPWFLTLFGRDSIWAARMLLTIDVRIAAGTLKVLARLQGTTTDRTTGERPGGILHELRRGETALSEGLTLPPRYYGTIDATPLWILLLHDAWRAGLPDDEVRGLLPALRSALGWLRAAVPQDGFLAYHDESGHGLANQGWKDSGDSVRWRDGRLAQGPISLCEVQGYAHEAALAAAALLIAFGDPDEAAPWAAWAAQLKARFRDAFWVQDGEGGYPAIALDADGRAVDSLTSNIGHLLGTGLLDAADEARVASLLVDPRLDSGYGLRTMADDSGGFWPLSYHCGSVWAHDTAIAVHGLIRAGFPAEARRLAEGLVAAAEGFGWRMPELFSGAADGAPVPYPAACHPQAWSAAAAVEVRAALAPGTDPVASPT